MKASTGPATPHLCSAPHQEPHAHRPQPPQRSFPFASLSYRAATLRVATHPSLARVQGFVFVCGLAGLGAAGWSPELLPPGTTPLAGPLPDVSKTVPPSGGALHGQRVPPGPAHRWRAPTSSQVRGRPTRSPTPCWAPLATLTTKAASSLCSWPATCHTQPYLQQQPGRM